MPTGLGLNLGQAMAMAQAREAQSLDELRAAVERDFTKNVFVSHGLFRSPYPCGAHLLCEVDTSSLPDDKWGNRSVEFVLRVVPLGDGSRLETTVVKVLNALHGEVTLLPASFQSLISVLENAESCSGGLQALTGLQDEALLRRLDELCLRCSHPNIVPLSGAILGKENLYLVLPPAPFTLRSVLHFSPNALGDDWQIRLLIYQILQGLKHCHSLGLAHGKLTPSNILLSSSMWCWLTGFMSSIQDVEQHRSCQPVIPKEPAFDQELEWKSQFKSWWRGELSNFDYLLLLNRLAGRRWGDRCFHTVMPWVIDFSVRPDEKNELGWRDLTKSKWRLAKGDEQLDFTYATADIPHHVSDECLSELAVCIYKARRLPLLVLRRVVRSVYEPNEYPVNMQRLYQWTPDECVPEFYCDPNIFYSSHEGMGDLAVPHWAHDPEEFIRLHRAALESERVSRQIHHWIDLTFGYKLSGEPAVSAKNVTLSTTPPTVPRSSGRRQLFLKPHPPRQVKSHITSLEQLEEANSFSEAARGLSPWYGPSVVNEAMSVAPQPSPHVSATALQTLLRHVVESNQRLRDSLFQKFQLEEEEDEALLYQRLIGWQAEVSMPKLIKHSESADIFAAGCLIAEIYLRKPLFDSTTAAAWSETGALPSAINELAPHIRALVETTLLKNFERRPAAEMLLDSPFFPSPVRSAYIFLSSLHFLATKQDRLHYAAKMAQHTVFVLMGPVATELCTPACLSVLRPPYHELDPLDVTVLLKSLLQVLNQRASRRLLVPIVESILQENEAVRLKSGLLASTFIKNLRRIVGTGVYLQHIHPLIVLNVLRSSESQGGAASVVLVDTCQELGLPISLHQTIFPLLQSLGRDITVHGINALVDIGEKFGEQAIVKHWLPALRFAFGLGAEASIEKTGPLQSWRLLAASDALTALERLIPFLSPASIVKELLQEPNNVFFRILQQRSFPREFLQNAAKTMLSACSQAGPELTCLHVMGQFNQLFDDLAFGRRDIEDLGNVDNNDRLELVYILYPELASLLGIEKLRQAFPTWLLLEQALSKKFEWKWTDMSTQRNRSTQVLPIVENVPDSPQTFSPANLLLNGVGWSIPQSQATKWTRTSHGPGADTLSSRPTFDPNDEPWFWVPSHDGPGGVDTASRIGVAHAVSKDEQSWKLNAIVAHSWRAHSGILKASKLGDGESLIFTAGGVRGKSVVKKWDLSTTKCILEYAEHEEAVNDICVLQGFERVASCDGTVHIWNSETGKRLALLDETFNTSLSGSISLEGKSGTRSDAVDVNMTNGILSGGNLYTFMHFMEAERRLVVGTTSGFLRFIDATEGRQLFSWRCEPSETSLSSFVSSVVSSSSEEHSGVRLASWIAIGFSSGHCSLLDSRSGSVIGHWRAHGAEITTLAPLQHNYLVSSSLDRTISIWDLRRSWPLQPQIFQGHTDAVTSFALWGTNILSAAGNKIGVSSFSKLLQQGQPKQIINPRKIYTSDRSSRNLSTINTISVLPFSRQFVIGTDDGFLKICV